MEENHKILMIKKLLSKLLFDKYDIDFDVWDMPYDSYSSSPKYGLTIKLDPEKVTMMGNEYDSSIGNILFTFNHKVNSLLSYIGLYDYDFRIYYEFINNEEFSNKIKQKVLNVLPSIYNKIPNLPKINKIFVHPRSKSIPDFEMIIEFDEHYNSFMETKNIEGNLIHELHSLLPELGDIYVDFKYN